MEDLDFGLPLEKIKEIPVNLYVWNDGGFCVGEKMDSLIHDPILGLNIRHVRLIDKNVAINYEVAKSGQGSSWLGTSSGLTYLCGFLPRSECGHIIGFCLLLTDFHLAFLSDSGVFAPPSRSPDWDSGEPTGLDS